MRLRAIAVVVSLLLLAQPASVAATAYSAVTHKFLWTPAGYTLTNLCVQAGEVDVNRNYGQAQAWVFSGSTNCSGTTRTLPSGWLGSLWRAIETGRTAARLAGTTVPRRLGPGNSG